MSNPILNNLIAHTITKLVDMQAEFAKTKLVKLLYLVDVENYRRSRRTLSGLHWYFYHYGPYAFEIDDALDELSLDIPQESVKTGSGHNAIVFRPDRSMRSRLGDFVDTPELRLVDRVIQKWGEMELNPLLNHVYFYTEPMTDAERGELLDFSTIQRHRPQRNIEGSMGMAPDRLDEYGARFKEAMDKRIRPQLEPAPRFDEVFWEGLARMNREESYRVPPVGVDMSEEAKARIREQWDGEIVG